MVHVNEKYFIMKRPFLMKSNNLKSAIRRPSIIEAATRDVLCKKVFLEISRNSQENTCARVSFLIKLQS